MPRGRVRRLCEQKSDANLSNRPSILFERQVDAHAQRFQHIRGTALRTRRAVAVFRDARARRCRNNRRCRRNIKRVRAIASRAARVNHLLGARFAISEDSRGISPHHPRESRKFLYLHRPLVQRRQQTQDLRRLHAPGEQLFHHGLCLRACIEEARFKALDFCVKSAHFAAVLRVLARVRRSG